MALASTSGCEPRCPPGWTPHLDVCVRARFSADAGRDSSSGGAASNLHGGNAGRQPELPNPSKHDAGAGGAPSCTKDVCKDAGADVAIDTGMAENPGQRKDTGEAGGRRCSPDVPFKKIHALDGPVNTPPAGWDTSGGSLSGDGLSLFFVRSARGDAGAMAPYQIYSASRANRTDVFTQVAPLAINGPTVNSSPSVTADGLRLYFLSMDEMGIIRIMVATRASSGEPFTAASPLEGLDIGSRLVASVFVTADGGSLYLSLVGGLPEDASSETSLASGDLFVATPGQGARFSLAALDSVNASGITEVAPVVSEDELVLYFARWVGDTNYDIYVATRATRDAAFGMPRPLELTTDRPELPSYVTPDLCTLYFFDDLPSTPQIWVAER